jgi:hypothetical protein
LIERQNDIEYGKQFLKNLGIRRSGTAQKTAEPAGTVFDGIFKSKPNIPLELDKKTQGSKVIEQKRMLEERAKMAASEMTNRQSLLDIEMSKKEDQ